MAQGVPTGLLIGVAIAVCREMLLALAAALWLRRERRIAMTALLGVATSELALCSVGVWTGGWIAAAVPDIGLQSTVAVGLLAGVAVWLVVGMMMGPRGVPGNAVLPTRPVATWARFVAIGLFSPIPAILVGANALAWPRLTADGAGVGLVAGAVAGALFLRWQWALASEANRGVRSTRSMHAGLWIGGILLISIFVIPIVDR